MAEPDDGDSFDALRRYGAAAEQGDAEAQYQLGLAYNSGKGAPWNVGKATAWYRRAAEKGHADAQCVLGDFCRSSDKTEALHWYRCAAEQGHARAQCWLGACYWAGEGVARDYPEAARWTRLAAEAGHGMAQSLLGYFYEDGVGVGQDYNEAARWYRLAGEQGDVRAQVGLGRFYERGKGVGSDDGAEADWYQLAADHDWRSELQPGDPASSPTEYYVADAEVRLGAWYACRSSVPDDIAAARKWLGRASGHGEHVWAVAARDHRVRDLELAASLLWIADSHRDETLRRYALAVLSKPHLTSAERTEAQGIAFSEETATVARDGNDRGPESRLGADPPRNDRRHFPWSAAMADSKPVLPIAWRRGQYILPSPVLQHEGATLGGALISLHLRLEDESLVDIPLGRDAIENLAEFLASLNRTYPAIPRLTWRARLRFAWLSLKPVERAACIMAVAFLVIGIEVGGLYAAVTDAKGVTYVVNRFTGSGYSCIGGTCRGSN